MTSANAPKKKSTPAILKVENIGIRFGGVQAVEDLSFSVTENELVSLIGPNGAGKTTTLRMISGMLKPDCGRVELNGRDVTSLPTHRRIRAGLAVTHQIVKPFRSMSVLENVVLAAGVLRTARPLRALFQIDRKPEIESAKKILQQVGLGGLENENADELPLGRLKRLEVARALALKPKIILFDEPLAGLNEQEATAMVDAIVDLLKTGLTVVLVEHNLSEVLRVSDRLLVLDSGRLIADGPPDACMADRTVIEAYIGSGGNHA